MFCFHCQETTNNLNCAIRGVCGKSPEVATLQDLLVYALKYPSRNYFWGKKVSWQSPY